MKIQPARRIRGRLRLPGDKSISHRAALLAALADGDSVLDNFSTGADCASTLDCLRQLGVSIEREGARVQIGGVGTRGLRASDVPLDCGNSGSTLRLLAGALAGQAFASELTGDASLRARPMRRIIEPLELMGARIASVEGRAPLHITGRQPLAPVAYEMPVASAQIKSCILLAALNAEGQTSIIERGGPSRDHTERMLQWLNVPVVVRTLEGDEALTSISLAGPARINRFAATIPGDISSAAFFMIAATLLPSSRLQLDNVGLNQTRSRLIRTLLALGADVRVNMINDGWLPEDFNEPFGEISVNGVAGLVASEEESSNVLRGALVPQLIDELPVLAVLGTQVSGGLTIRDAKELRVKESDRIAAVVENLRAMGAEVLEHEDGMTIRGRTRLHGARLRTHGDHRIAMAFTVAALIAEGESELDDAACARISFPEFFDLLESVVER